MSESQRNKYISPPPCSVLKRLPKIWDRLLWKGQPVVVLEVRCNGNFASSIFIQDSDKKVYEL